MHKPFSLFLFILEDWSFINYYCTTIARWCSISSKLHFRYHCRPPAAPEEEEERILSSSTSAEGHSVVLETGVELPSAGEEGDEGSYELSDEVSRDSTMGSDSDTFSSPFCLSPVSEALCESGSVFLDNDSRWVQNWALNSITASFINYKMYNTSIS